jgi:hypothetical protein
METLDATGHNAMFGDDYINFDLHLESFDVDMGALKEPAIEHVFGHGWKIGKKKQERKMTVLLRHSCLQNIKVLSFVILTQGNHFQFGNKIWSTAEGEVTDGS